MISSRATEECSHPVTLPEPDLGSPAAGELCFTSADVLCLDSSARRMLGYSAIDSAVQADAQEREQAVQRCALTERADVLAKLRSACAGRNGEDLRRAIQEAERAGITGAVLRLPKRVLAEVELHEQASASHSQGSTPSGMDDCPAASRKKEDEALHTTADILCFDAATVHMLGYPELAQLNGDADESVDSACVVGSNKDQLDGVQEAEDCSARSAEPGPPLATTAPLRHERPEPEREPEGPGPSGSVECLVPCEICGAGVAFGDYDAHLARCAAGDRGDHDAGRERGAAGDAGALIPCDECGELVLFEAFSAHVAGHREALDSAAALREHHRFTEDELQSSSTPAALAMQVVACARRSGDKLPGTWQSASDVCNFDAAVPFVEEMRRLEARGVNLEIEIVYHWTRAENLASIVDNSLRLPGDANADGSRVAMAHGQRYGRGIYTATELELGRAYGRGAAAALVCLALPGDRAEDGRLGPGADSLAHGSLRVYRSSEQLLPLFLTDLEHGERTARAARKVADLLQTQLRRLPLLGTDGQLVVG